MCEDLDIQIETVWEGLLRISNEFPDDGGVAGSEEHSGTEVIM